jgi:uncharacterized membrane protein YkoI
MFGDGMNLVRLLAVLLMFGVSALAAAGADARSLESSVNELEAQYGEGMGQYRDRAEPGIRVAQKNGGKSLSEAIDQVRRQTGGRILSAETKVSGDRDVHHIKVLTKDGKVKTYKVQGHKRGD